MKIASPISSIDGVMNIGSGLFEGFVFVDSTFWGENLQVLWYNKLMDFELIQQFGAALALSTLIGLEREQEKKSKKDLSFAGVRSFALIGLLGALAFYLLNISLAAFILISSVFFVLIVSSYLIVGMKKLRIGITTELAAIVTFLVGGLCVSGDYMLAVVVSLITLSVLYFKEPIHKWAHGINADEILSTIKFVIIAFIILPLLPNQGYGPYEVFNPYVIWLMVVFISGISFASYIAIKWLGARKGIGLTGFLAGLISSTALAMSYSKESKVNKSIVNPYVFAIIVASTATYFRVLLEIFVLNRDMVFKAMIPMGSMAFIGVVASVWLWCWKDKGSCKRLSKKDYSIKSPFRLMPALQFGLFFAVILFISKVGHEYLGDKGTYLVSFVSGFVDMDAITVSMAKLGQNGLGHEVAVKSITIAAIANTLFKGSLFLIFGSRKTAFRVLSVFGLMILAGLASLLLI